MDPKLVHKKQVAIRGVSIISIALILIIWTVSTNLKWVDPIFLPTPQSVWKTFLELLFIYGNLVYSIHLIRCSLMISCFA
nr:hypothetical protein [Bacillus methanolicus]